MIHTKGADTNTNEKHVLRHREPPLSETTLALDPDIRHKLHGNHDRHDLNHANMDDHRIFNHRNRDKWNMQPPTYREPSPYNPIVLKFSNRPHSARQVNSQELYHHRHHQSDGAYRKVPDDLSYIFGLKARPHISHR